MLRSDDPIISAVQSLSAYEAATSICVYSEIHSNRLTDHPKTKLWSKEAKLPQMEPKEIDV